MDQGLEPLVQPPLELPDHLEPTELDNTPALQATSAAQPELDMELSVDQGPEPAEQLALLEQESLEQLEPPPQEQLELQTELDMDLPAMEQELLMEQATTELEPLMEEHQEVHQARSQEPHMDNQPPAVFPHPSDKDTLQATKEPPEHQGQAELDQLTPSKQRNETLCD